MKAMRPFAWVLGAAIALVVLFAMPSFAEAHAGHTGHGAQAVSAPAWEPSIVAPVQEAGVTEAGKATTAQSADHSELSAASGSADKGCTGVICCGNMHCAACGFVMAADPAFFGPHGSGAASALTISNVISGLGPSDLSRPPRSFV